MGYRFVVWLAGALVVVVGWQAIELRAVHAQPAQAVIPFAEGITLQDLTLTGGATLFARHANGTYSSLNFNVSQPYSLLSSMSVLLQLISEGPKNLLAAPAGPAGVGRQSQIGALADLGNNGSAGVAVASGSGVTVYQGTSGFSYRSAVTYPIGQDVNSVFFADFNGDGLPDLAVAYDGGSGPGGIAILLNQGGGTFASAVTYASGTQASRFAVLDLNHDGNLDIATASFGGKVTVVLGKGDGTFGSPVQYTVGTEAGAGSGAAIAIADVNGDGNPDLVVGGSTGILLGKGDGTFRPGSPLPAAASSTFVWAFAAGDLNGDGKIDLVYADTQNQVIGPLYGNGDGTFTAGPAYAVSVLPDSLVLADYNNDGRLDIINGTGDARGFGPADQSSNINILLNNGDGTFQGAPAYFTIATTTAQMSGYTSSTVAGMTTGKFGGSAQGILATGFDGGLTLFLGNGKGGLEAPQSVAVTGGVRAAVAAADFNGDGKADAAIVQQSDNSLAILLGTASGFGAPTAVSTGGVVPASIVTADLNGDGNIDLAVAGQANGSGAMAILLGNGDGTFQPAITMPAGTSPVYLSAADLNGDGKPDLIFADNGTNGNGGGIYVSLNTGGGTFHAPVEVFTGIYCVFAIGDVNGDGKPDLVAGNNAMEGMLSWLAGKGDGTFQAPIAITTSDDTDGAVLVQDFNGDGHTDIVLAHQSEQATLLAGNGNGTFSAETPLLSAAEPTLLLTTDLNGDGKPDLLVGGSSITVLLNKGISTATVVSAANPAAAAVAPGSLASAYGTDLAKGAPGGTSLPLPTSFGGTSVSILDSSATTTLAPLLYVGSTQVNFEVPPGVATGSAQITVISGDGTQSVANVQIAAVAPGLFQLNSSGLAAAYAAVYHSNGTQTVEQVYSVNSAGAIVANPISLGSSTDQTYLFLFGTGLEAAGTSGVTVSVAGSKVPVSYAGTQGSFVGLDQVNVKLPASLAGKGSVTIQLTANGLAANAVNITIQ